MSGFDGLSESEHSQLMGLLQDCQLLLMERYSEDAWAAGWMMGLEEELWRKPEEPGPTIRKLAEWAEIWWVHDPRPNHPSRAAVPIEVWRRKMESDQ